MNNLAENIIDFGDAKKQAKQLKLLTKNFKEWISSEDACNAFLAWTEQKNRKAMPQETMTMLRSSYALISK